MATITEPIVSLTPINYQNSVIGPVQYLMKTVTVPTPTPQFTITVPNKEKWV